MFGASLSGSNVVLNNKIIVLSQGEQHRNAAANFEVSKFTGASPVFSAIAWLSY